MQRAVLIMIGLASVRLFVTHVKMTQATIMQPSPQHACPMSALEIF